jgi:apolipoprotein N-acyltransferase
MIRNTEETGDVKSNQVFQGSFRACITFGLVWTSLMGMFVLGLFWLGKARALPAGTYLLIFLGLFVVLTSLAFLMRLICRVEVRLTALRTRSSWGKMVDVPWQAMRDVKMMSVGGLPFLNVTYDHASRPAFFPLWLSNFNDFVQACKANAGDDHVVTRWLIEHPRARRFVF